MTDNTANSNKKYYVGFTTLCFASFLLGFGMSMLDSIYLKTTHFWVPILFFIITTLISNRFLTKGIQDPKEFVLKSLGITVARLLLCMIIIFAYSLIFKETKLAFSCHFMLQYITFTIFELSYILKHIRTNQ